MREAAAAGPGAREALDELYGEYWFPIRRIVARWFGAEQADELTQKFIVERFVDKGELKRVEQRSGSRFRGWLTTRVLSFMRVEWKRLKRQREVSASCTALDGGDGGADVWQSRELSPEQQWWRTKAYAMLEEVLERLKREYCEKAAAAGVADPERRFDAVKRFLPGRETEDADYAETARALGMSRDAVKGLVCQLRKRFGKLLHERIQGGTDTDDDVALVKRTLCQALELPPEPGQ